MEVVQHRWGKSEQSEIGKPQSIRSQQRVNLQVILSNRLASQGNRRAGATIGHSRSRSSTSTKKMVLQCMLNWHLGGAVDTEHVAIGKALGRTGGANANVGVDAASHLIHAHAHTHTHTRTRTRTHTRTQTNNHRTRTHKRTHARTHALTRTRTRTRTCIRTRTCTARARARTYRTQARKRRARAPAHPPSLPPFLPRTHAPSHSICSPWYETLNQRVNRCSSASICSALRVRSQRKKTGRGGESERGREQEGRRRAREQERWSATAHHDNDHVGQCTAV